MKIFTVITQMEGGGAQNAAIRVAQELAKRGHSTKTCFLHMKRPAYAQYDNIKIILDRHAASPLDYLTIFFRLVRFFREERPDAVIGFTYYANVFAAAAALLAGVKVRVASQRNPSWTYPLAGRILDKLAGALGGYTANIAVSNAVFDSFAHYPAPYTSKMSVVYNGIPQRSATLSRSESRARFGLPQEKTLLVTTGRLSEQKNHEVLIKALATLPEVHLAIAGGGELEGELHALTETLGVRDRVHFVGELPAEEIPDFLKGGDLFVFPSRFEAFGFSVMEAALAGMPLLVSDIPALREILDAWQGSAPCAIFLPAEDAGKWRSAIADLIAQHAVLERHAAAAAERAAHFTLERMINGYEGKLEAYS